MPSCRSAVAGRSRANRAHPRATSANRAHPRAAAARALPPSRSAAARALCALAVAALVTLAAPFAPVAPASQVASSESPLLNQVLSPLAHKAYAGEQEIGSELNGRVIRLTPTGKTHEVNIHNDGWVIGNDVRTYFLGTSSKLKLTWDSGHGAYAIGYFQQFDERMRGSYYFDVDGQKTKDGSVVHVWSWNSDNSSMFWRFCQNDDGTFYIKNCRSGTYLGLEKDTDGNDVKLVINSKDKATKWDVEVIDEPLSSTSQTNTYAPARDWMSHLPDSTPLSEITMPGTHDTGTCNMPDAGAQSSLDACQKYYVDEQLNVGVRAFDLRLGGDLGVDDPFIIHNSIAFPCQNRDASYLRLSDVMSWYKEFLQAHPGETLLVCVKNDEGSNKAITQAVERYINEKDSIVWDGEGIPTLGEARGKIVLLRRYQLEGNSLPSYRFGFDLTGWDNNNYPGSKIPLQIYSQTDEGTGLTSQVWVQDYYGTDGETKIGYVRESMDWASGHSFGDNTRAYVYNYASCTKTNPFSAARYVNAHLINDARWQGYGTSSAKKEFLGIVMMDFIDGTWARNLYLKNFVNCDMGSVEFPTSATAYAYEPANTVALAGGKAPDGCRFVAEGSQTFTVEDENPQVSVSCVDGSGSILCSAMVPVTVQPRPVNVRAYATTITYGDVRIGAEDPYDEKVKFDVRPRSSDIELSGMGMPDGMDQSALGTVFAVEGAPLAAGSYRPAGSSYEIVARPSPNPNFAVHHEWVTSAGVGANYSVGRLTAQLAWEGDENLVYDPQSCSNVTARVTNLPEGLDPSTCRVVVEGGVQQDAGAYTATATELAGSNAGNVVLWESSKAHPYTIAKATPTGIEYDPLVLVYGEALPTEPQECSVWVGDTLVPATYTFADPVARLHAGDSDQAVVATPSSPEDKANIEDFSATVAVHVEPRHVSVRGVDVVTTYGDPLPGAECELVDGALVKGDSLDSLVTASYGDGKNIGENYTVKGVKYNATPAGEYPVNVEVDEGASADYVVDNAFSGRLTIVPRIAELEWENCDNRYLGDDRDDPAASVKNAIPLNPSGTDDVGVEVSEPKSESHPESAAPDVGLYSVTAENLTGDSEKSYRLPVDATRTYFMRGEVREHVFPGRAHITYGDLLNDDNLVLEGGSGDGTFKVEWKDATVKKLDDTVMDITKPLPAGEYTLTATLLFTPHDPSSGAIDGQLSQENAAIALTVYKKPIVAWAQSATKVYGEKLGNYEAACRPGALVPGDNVDALNVTIDAYESADPKKSLAEYNVPGVSPQYNNAPVGSYPLIGTQTPDGSTPDGSTVHNNYDVTVVPGTLTITPRLAELVWTGMDTNTAPLVYDGEKKNVAASVTNLVPKDATGNSDDVTVAVRNGDAVNAGTYHALATGLGGADAQNYRLPHPGEGLFASRHQKYAIGKAVPDVTWPTRITVEYGQRLIRAQYEGQSVEGVKADEGEKREQLPGRFAFAKGQLLFQPEGAGTISEIKAADGSSQSLELVFHPFDKGDASVARNYNTVHSTPADGISVEVLPKPVVAEVPDVVTEFGDMKPDLAFDFDESQLVNADELDDLEVTLTCSGLVENFAVGEGDTATTWNRTPAGEYDISAASSSANYAVTFTGSQAPGAAAELSGSAGEGAGESAAESASEDAAADAAASAAAKDAAGAATPSAAAGVASGAVATARVEPRTVTLEWSGTEGLVYNGKPASVTAEAGNLVPRTEAGDLDQVSVVVEGGAEVHAGDYVAHATALRDEGALSAVLRLTGESANYRLPADGTESTPYAIAKAVPNPTFPDEGTAVLGAPVSTAVFAVAGTSDVPGTFTFQEPDTPVHEGTGGYPMTFAPDDARDWESVDGWGNVTSTDAPSADVPGGSEHDGGGNGVYRALAPTGDAAMPLVGLLCALAALGTVAAAAAATRRVPAARRR